MRQALGAVRAGAGRLIEIVGEAGVGKTRLLEALREEASGLHHAALSMRDVHGVDTLCGLARAPARVHGLRTRRSRRRRRRAPPQRGGTRAPDLLPWLPLIAIAFGLEVAPTPEVELLAETNRRAKLHESVGRILEVLMPDPQLIEFESVHNMDEASAEFLAHLIGELPNRPWLIGVSRRPSEAGSRRPNRRR